MWQILILSFLLFACPIYAADDRPFGAWEDNMGNKAEERRESTPFSRSLAIGGVRFYQHYISPVIGDRCPMYPSCSAYSIEAIKKHGFFIGIIMTADRLIHESDEMNLAPLIQIGDELRAWDPVENNDFWWAD